MRHEQPLSYPLSTEELHAALLRGRAARSEFLLSWLSPRTEAQPVRDLGTMPDRAASTAG